jgi:Icc-related predicted phosphoesterase
VVEALEWYNGLDIPTKVAIFGNHDTSVERGLVQLDNYPTITFLQHELKEIRGLKIFGSPYTPAFGFGWAYNVRRDRLYDTWQMIPEGIDILITHGPPKGVMDIAEGDGMEYCGCSALMNRVYEVRPKYMLFGHIHNNHGHINQGTRVFNDITFMNGSCMTDGQFSKGPTSHGIVFEIDVPD